MIGSTPGGTGCLRAQLLCLCSTYHDVRSGETSAATVRVGCSHSLYRKCWAAKVVKLDFSHKKMSIFGIPQADCLLTLEGVHCTLSLSPSLSSGIPLRNDLCAHHGCMCICMRVCDVKFATCRSVDCGEYNSHSGPKFNGVFECLI